MKEFDSLQMFLVKDVAKILKKSKNTVYAAIRNGELKAIKPLGEGYRIRRAELERLLNECNSSSLEDIGAPTSGSMERQNAQVCAPQIVGRQNGLCVTS